MTDIGPLYHWSPRERLKGIKRLGLVPSLRSIRGPVFHWNENDEADPSLGEYRQDSVSTSLDAATAWSYSHGSWRTVGTFDLWMFVLVPADEVEVRPMWGSRIIEVRVHNRIPKSRLIWVGERTVA